MIKAREIGEAGHVAHMGMTRNAYQSLIGKLEGKRPRGRPKSKWEGNIKINIKEIGYEDVE